ncbi:alpha/beta fold hydrolase [bacterium]|nr:alpha/beta fold hydrolase [bacterium]
MKKEIVLKAKDNTNIAINYYKQSFDEIVIIAPGWCMTKDSNAFCQISEMFSKFADVITLDFRGHGKSAGMYTFTAVELLDMDCVIRFARKNKYKKIHLAGFSLGGAMALIYASKSRFVDKIIVVSAPSDFNKIENKMWKKEAWGETFKKFEFDRFMSIRPYPIILKKIKPIEIIEKIKVPTLFIAGEKDPTVLPWHTEELYNCAKCPKKYKLYKNGCHAEDLFLHFMEDFSDLCFNWIKN